jgi:hypothetical protein
VTKSNAAPDWLREGPPNLGTDELAPPQTGVPHPADLSPDELAEWLGPDYSSSVVVSTPQSFLDPIWWSLGDAAEFIESSTESDDPDASPLFSGLNRIEQEIRSGQLTAYGSIDSAPVSAISREAWTEFELVPFDVKRNEDGTISYSVLVRSIRSYRASALKDHGHPSGTNVPSAFSTGGEPGYHRTISNVFVEEADVRGLIPRISSTERRGRGTGPKQKRLIATLPRIIIRGKRVYPTKPDDISIAEITRRAIKILKEEDQKSGDITDYVFSTEAQAVGRIYRDLSK